ncbi:hypothetical protein HNQ07_001712 [Deinococcus metalli]|uniref:Uncharacterized protein n=1 Tax=Deinococcus metalli TaxID=1141878 RepID=A0A7W8KDM0_9DEIO|nr:hypothetical protein [Deinococcus metalli]MBB5376255.1 hypothetical protein [Deinococcus metalli]GHF39670.1 hypothetical protein GCM10017781_15270 [Deinococcus metalli]
MTGKAISPDDRARLDQVFMQVVLDVQAQLQQTKPVQAGTLAAMFHKETVSDGLQGCAMLIAGWNQGRVDDAGMARATKALRALELPELAGRVEKLRGIDEA